MEAIFGLLSLGHALPDILIPPHTKPSESASQDTACEEAWSSLRKCQWCVCVCVGVCVSN